MWLVFTVILSTLCTRPSIWALEAMYEGFEQLNGTDFVDFQLRVTKINRTTAALNGTIFVKKPITNDFKIHVTALHSAKGNQQFNHYPLKIPSIDFCSFTTTFWPDYVKYYEPYVENNLLVGECPVEPRQIRINKHVVDGNMYPSYVPTGLWKLYIILQSDDGEGLCVSYSLKVFKDGFFG